MTTKEISGWVAAIASALGLGSSTYLQSQDASMCRAAYEETSENYAELVKHLISERDE